MGLSWMMITESGGVVIAKRRWVLLGGLRGMASKVGLWGEAESGVLSERKRFLSVKFFKFMKNSGSDGLIRDVVPRIFSGVLNGPHRTSPD
jgi:hypothetical protein